MDTAHGQAASQIKGLEADYVAGHLAHKLAHALAGCAAGAAAGGACKDGAIGAAVGEIVAGLMPPANGLVYSEVEKAKVLAYSKLIAGGVSAYAGGNAQTSITTAETAVKNNAFVPILVGLAWLADKAWTAYEVAQDVAAIRDGQKTVEQVAQERGEEYITAMVLGNIGRYGVKAVKTGGKWVQSKDEIFSQVAENRSLAAGKDPSHLLGKNGIKTSSTTVWKGEGRERIDVENPNPWNRAGQIHYQDNKNDKYYYQPDSNKFTLDAEGKFAAPKAVQALLKNQNFLTGINKTMKYLGEK